MVTTSNDWHRTFWKIVANPTVEVVTAMVVVLFAAWIVIAHETDFRQPPIPVIFGHK